MQQKKIKERGEDYMRQMFPFDCKNHGRRYVLISSEGSKKCFIFIPLPFKYDQR